MSPASCAFDFSQRYRWGFLEPGLISNLQKSAVGSSISPLQGDTVSAMLPAFLTYIGSRITQHTACVVLCLSSYAAQCIENGAVALMRFAPFLYCQVVVKKNHGV